VELRLVQLARRHRSEWDVQDIAEYNGLKQIAIMMAVAPVVAVLSATMLFVTRSPLGAPTFIVSFVPLMLMAFWCAGLVSRYGQVSERTLAPSAAGGTAAGAKTPPSPIRWIRLAGKGMVRRHGSDGWPGPVGAQARAESQAPSLVRWRGQTPSAAPVALRQR
jgi:hypothetical protein